jgi:hypothetical protein
MPNGFSMTGGRSSCNPHAKEPMMTLKEKTEAKKAEFQSMAAKDIQETMARAIEQLKQSGIEKKALKEGDEAPDFTLNDSEGAAVNLNEALAGGPVVLGFYRGRW